MADLQLTSETFDDGGPIPERCSRDGADVHPPLDITGVPEGAESLALIMEDPDAPSKTWVHWLIWNLPPCLERIDEGEVPDGAVEGHNDWGESSYGGPQPPSGTHRYFFRLYALDRTLELGPDSRRDDLEEAMKGHVLDEATLMGTYAA
ncbi:MAG TPA: YbhB/YbcL family Raf kinase inhibitor-like protein [Methylomirabilota bacterium]|nr:YbhB/YbcL family Raf kinase inhibitor-like protein [Methylomirabilota bacterium]